MRQRLLIRFLSAFGTPFAYGMAGLVRSYSPYAFHDGTAWQSVWSRLSPRARRRWHRRARQAHGTSTICAFAAPRRCARRRLQAIPDRLLACHFAGGIGPLGRRSQGKFCLALDRDGRGRGSFPAHQGRRRRRSEPPQGQGRRQISMSAACRSTCWPIPTPSPTWTTPSIPRPMSPMARASLTSCAPVRSTGRPPPPSIIPRRRPWPQPTRPNW